MTTQHKSSIPNQDTGTQAADVIESEEEAPSYGKCRIAERKRQAQSSLVGF